MIKLQIDRLATFSTRKLLIQETIKNHENPAELSTSKQHENPTKQGICEPSITGQLPSKVRSTKRVSSYSNWASLKILKIYITPTKPPASPRTEYMSMDKKPNIMLG